MFGMGVIQVLLIYSVYSFVLKKILLLFTFDHHFVAVLC